MLIGMIDGATRVLGKSQGYLGLPVRDEQMIDKTDGQIVPTMTTAWFPTPAELEALNAGQAIYVNLFGENHPPIMLYTGEAEQYHVENPALARLEIALKEWSGVMALRDFCRPSDVSLNAAIDAYFTDREQ